MSKIVFTSLVGSHNYNLNVEDSDKDFKSFMVPSFDELYDVELIKKDTQLKVQNDKEELCDIEYHDIRKLEKILFKSNINFLEILFSEEIEIDEYFTEEVAELVSIRKEIAKMNLTYIYRSCMGTYNSRRRDILKPTEGTQHLVDKYGYNTKQLLHAYRTLDFLKRFQNTGFNDFKDAIWYKDKDPMKEFLLDLKNGKLSLEEGLALLDRKEAVTKMYCEKAYLEREFDQVTYDKIKDILKRIVKKNITRELNERFNCNHCISSHLDDGPNGSYDMVCANINSKRFNSAVNSNIICNKYEED